MTREDLGKHAKPSTAWKDAAYEVWGESREVCGIGRCVGSGGVRDREVCGIGRRAGSGGVRDRLELPRGGI